ncbi:hypothetical protein NitYY0814_C0564 [Nitratiruptor sp. YY08-14]|nr:hypothetical protein NitYY0810_C0564 [Nitratiruptor sp. YY08-10]BCD63731.1 hypothetical protein NitYY0814_C0564 [Nitratiruptor sp. YY08-14]
MATCSLCMGAEKSDKEKKKSSNMVFTRIFHTFFIIMFEDTIKG